MRKFNRVLAASLTLAMGLSLVACGGSEKSTTAPAENDTKTTEAPASNDAKKDETPSDTKNDPSVAPDTTGWDASKKIYAYSWDDDFQKKLNVILDEYPQFKDYVEYVNLGSASEKSLEQIDTAIKSDKYPSLIPGDVGSAKYWIEDDDKTANLYDDAFGFTEEMVDRDYAYAKQYATYNGELKGVTWQSTAGSVFYNKAIAKEVFGADDPETVQAKLADWDTFFKTAEELKAKGYKITNGPDEIYYAIINAHKDPWVVVADDGTETLKLDDSVKTFIENYKKLYDGEYTNGGTMWDNDWAGNQKDGGNVLCYFACPWMIGVMQGNGASNGSFGAVVGPQAYYWGGTYVSIGKDTPNPALAAFICYELACDDDMGVKITNKTGDAVANKKANERLVNGEIAEDNNGVAFLGGQNPYATWAAAGENIDQSACTYFDKNYEVMIKAAAQGYATGTYATVDDAINYIYSQSETELGISKAK